MRVGRRQIEATLDQVSNNRALRLIEVIVAVRGFNKQSRQGKLQFVPWTTNFLVAIRPNTVDPRTDAVNHYFAYHAGRVGATPCGLRFCPTGSMIVCS